MKVPSYPKRSLARALGVCLSVSLLWTLAVAASGAQSPPAAGSQEELIAKAREAELNHNFPAAAQFYADYLKIHPDNPEILQRLGLVNYLSSHFDAAIPPLAKALKLNPSLWGSALYLGVSYYRTDRFTDAMRAFRQALALKPGLPDAEFWLGSSLLAVDQPESAIPHLVQAAQNAKWGAQADNLLIKAYKKAAEDSYQHIATVAPDSYRVHLVKAELLEWEGINSQAMWEARQALQRNPDLEGAHRLIAEVCWQERGFDLAAKEFQAELQINPLDPESNLRLGEFWLAQGEAQKALPFLNVAQAGHTGTPGETWHFLGEAELALHNNPAAVADLQRAVEQNPADPANHRLLAQAYRATGNLDLADQQERLAQIPPAASSPSEH